MKIDISLEELIIQQLYTQFMELYNFSAAILDFSRHIEFQNIRFELFDLGNTKNAQKVSVLVK